MRKQEILLVDDEPVNVKLYIKMLEGNDYEITSVENGLQCLRQVKRRLPDLILLDWNMPEMNGIETLTALKKDERAKDIPILMITGVMTASKDLETAMNSGAVDFMKKPFDKLELNARIRNVLLLSNSLKSLKKQNEKLDSQNLFITSLIESIPHPIAFCSMDGKIRECNYFLAELLESQIKDLLGKPLIQFCIGDKKNIHKIKDREVEQNKTSVFYETNGFPGNKTFLVYKNSVNDKWGKPIGIITVFTDITEVKRANNAIINAKKVELISNTMKLMHVNEINTNLIDSFQKIAPHTNQEGKKLIQEIISSYNLNVSEHIWNDFESKFENVFDSFYQTLLTLYPKLTTTERKLCALLRSGLSSKNIANLTFQNPQSVDVARYRIRKKLNLGTDENLVDFLIKIDTTS